MKTQTKFQIVKLIEKSGPSRPADLSAKLGISPQALHRHLKKLSEQGILEPLGTPPFTRYSIAGVPNFDSAFDWIKSPKVPEGTFSNVSETRDVLSARLPRLKTVVSSGFPAKNLPLMISSTAEISNNSFDHNLGQWRDTPGCWLEHQITGHILWICVADRGQGVFKSLSRVHPSITSDQLALEAAFEKVISGRAPEQRGNGLKFVKNGITESTGRGLACASGNGRVQYGDLGGKCAALLTQHLSKVRGTITLMIWSL